MELTLIKRIIIIFSVMCLTVPLLYNRIQNFSEPNHEQRLQHHMGDGATELGVLSAHRYWRDFGFSSSYFLPCVNDWNYKIQTTRSAKDCVPYTHYPPGMYLLSSALLHIFSSSEAPLVKTRWSILLLSNLIIAIAITIFSLRMQFSLLKMSLVSLLIPFSYGYKIFSDNLFGHGLVFAYQGLILAFILSQIPSHRIAASETSAQTLVQLLRTRSAFLYGILCFIGSWLSVEILPVFFLAPFLLLFSINSSSAIGEYSSLDIHYRKWKAARPIIFAFLLTATLAFLFCVLIRIVQNAFYLGSLTAVWEDWISILRYRLGAGSDHHTIHHTIHHTMIPAQTYVIEWTISFWKNYFLEILRYQRIIISAAGQVFIFVIFAYFLVTRKWKTLIFLVLFFLIFNSWNFLFIQHSYIHLYTSRYILWTLIFGTICLLKESWARK